MASVSLRSGHLAVDFRYRGIRCRERTGLSDTPQNRRKLQRLVARMEAEILLRTFEYAHYFPASPRVRQFCDIDLAIARSAHEVPAFREFTQTWFTESAVAWRHSHIECVRGVVDQHLLPGFGDIRLDEISRADVLAFRAELANKERAGRRKALLAATINRILRPLRSILNEAASRYGFSSPVRDIKPLAGPRTRVEPFTLEEVRRFLNAVRKDFHPYYTVRFFTGMRTGEIDGLKWKHVDFERRRILVRETFVMGRDTYTKNDHSQREIAMSEPVFRALQAQRERTRNHVFVFCNARGNPLDYSNVARRVWHPMLRRLGLAPRKPYQTRHTAATPWLAAGENPEWIARQMGHATTEMLFRVYSRYVPNITRRDGSAWSTVAFGFFVSWLAIRFNGQWFADVLDWPLTAREAGDMNLVITYAAHLTLTLGWFLLTLLFYKPLSAQRQQEVDNYYRDFDTPVVSPEGVDDNDNMQRRRLGMMTAAFGALTCLLVLAGSEAGRVWVFLGCGGFLLTVGGLLVYFSRTRTTVFGLEAQGSGDL